MIENGITRRASFLGFGVGLLSLGSKSRKGDPSAADHVARNILELKAAPVAKETMFWGGVAFRWQTANAPYTSDEDQPFTTVVESDHETLGAGAWVRQATESVAFNQDHLGSITRSAQEKLREIVSIEDFGAVSDSTTDVTAAIQAALNSGAAHVMATPRAGHFFKLTKTLSIPADVTFDARGANFKQTTPGQNGFTLGSRAQLRSAVLEGADGNSSKAALEEANGIFVEDANSWQVQDCTIFGWQHNGVYARNCNLFLVSQNRMHSNRYVNSSSSDVLIWSKVLSRGGIITDNWCLSNNSQGIYYGVAGYDVDGIISQNQILAADYTSGTPLHANYLRRRWGIVMGYGAAARALICANNIIRNTTAGGIYRQAGTAPIGPGAVLVLGNTISDTGINSPQPSLSSAINFAAQGDGDIVAFNNIEHHHEPILGASAGISIQPNGGEQAEAASTLVMGNRISQSASHGIVVTYQARNVTVESNVVCGCARTSIYYVPTTVRLATDFFVLRGNEIFHDADKAPAILLAPDVAAGNERIIVEHNAVRGLNRTTNRIDNAGILFNANAVAAGLEIRLNRISRFRVGIGPNYYISTALTAVVDGNRIENCHTGIGVSGSGSGGSLFVSSCIFNGNTTNLGSGPLAGASRVFEAQLNGHIPTIYATEPPTVGTFPVGTRVVSTNPISGAPDYWRRSADGKWLPGPNLP